MENYFGLVYLITNKINNKKYVGQTSQTLQERWSQHKNVAKKYKNKYALTNAIRKYGNSNFEINAIDYAKDQNELNFLEALYSVLYNCYVPNGYNLDICGFKKTRRHPSSVRKMSKSYEIKSPAGKIFKVKNMKEFCEKHNLRARSIHRVANGTRKQNKGWTKPNTNLKIIKLLSPNMEKVDVIDCFYYRTQFCKNNNLTVSGLSALINGKCKTHMGWSLQDNIHSIKSYKVVSPTGDIFDVKYRNIKEFAKLHNLNRRCLNRVLLGKQHKTGNWKLLKQNDA